LKITVLKVTNLACGCTVLNHKLKLLIIRIAVALSGPIRAV
jgi:hypothetical protein